MLCKCPVLVPAHCRCLPQAVTGTPTSVPRVQPVLLVKPLPHTPSCRLTFQFGKPVLLPSFLPSLLASTKLPPGPADFKAFPSSKAVAQRGSAQAVSCWEQEGGSCNQLPFVPLAGAQQGFPGLGVPGRSCVCPRPQHTELAGEAPLQSLPGEGQAVQVPGAAVGSRNTPAARACPLAGAKACVGPAQAGLLPQAGPKRSQTPSSPGLGAQHEAGLGQAIHRDG